jgi:uncharacterized membrane protein
MIGLIFTLFFVKMYEITAIKEYNISKEFFSFGVLYILFVFAWYIYVSGSSLFYAVTSIGNSVFGSIWTSFFSPDASRGAYTIAKHVSGLKLISKYMNLGVPFFIISGMFKVLWDFINKKSKFDAVYLGLSLYFMGLLVGSVVLPHFAVMSPGRLWIIALIMVSPFFIIGGKILFKNIFKLFKIRIKQLNILKVLGCYILIIMLFSTGFIYEITKEHPSSIALSQNSIKKYGTMEDRASFYARFIVGYDAEAIKWLGQYKKYDTLYYTSGYTLIGSSTPNNYGSPDFKVKQLDNHAKITNNSYLWKIYVNIKENIAFGSIPGISWFSYFNFSDISYKFNDKNKIYDNGGSQIFIP